MSSAPQSLEDRTLGLTFSKPAAWRVTDVAVLSAYRLRVKFSDGLSGEVVMDDLIRSDYAGVFEPLRDFERFRQVGVVLGAVTWPGELDLAPDAMYDDIKAHGVSEVRAYRPD